MEDFAGTVRTDRRRCVRFVTDPDGKPVKCPRRPIASGWLQVGREWHQLRRLLALGSATGSPLTPSRRSRREPRTERSSLVVSGAVALPAGSCHGLRANHLPADEGLRRTSRAPGHLGQPPLTWPPRSRSDPDTCLSSRSCSFRAAMADESPRLPGRAVLTHGRARVLLLRAFSAHRATCLP